jgi:hypothetical protein
LYLPFNKTWYSNRIPSLITTLREPTASQDIQFYFWCAGTDISRDTQHELSVVLITKSLERSSCCCCPLSWNHTLSKPLRITFRIQNVKTFSESKVAANTQVRSAVILIFVDGKIKSVTMGKLSDSVSRFKIICQLT